MHLCADRAYAELFIRRNTVLNDDEIKPPIRAAQTCELSPPTPVGFLLEDSRLEAFYELDHYLQTVHIIKHFPNAYRESLDGVSSLLDSYCSSPDGLISQCMFPLPRHFSATFIFQCNFPCVILVPHHLYTLNRSILSHHSWVNIQPNCLHMKPLVVFAYSCEPVWKNPLYCISSISDWDGWKNWFTSSADWKTEMKEEGTNAWKG